MKILLTGGTGLLGQALIATAGAEHRISVLHLRDYPVPVNGVEMVVLNILERERLEEFFAAHDFDVVVHAAGIASVDYVERHFEEAWESNVVGTQNVVDLVCKRGMRIVYVSSNAVFDGANAPYREEDRTNPVNRYGQIKVECERIVRRMCQEAIVVRPILMYGWHLAQGRTNPVTWLIERLQRGESTHIVTDVYENPIWSHHCAQAIWRAIQLGKAGTFHVGGKDVVNRYDFAKLVAEVFGLDASLLHPVDSRFFPAIAPRPKNTSFVTERMQSELGMEPLSLRQGLERMRSLPHPSHPFRLT
jgi:dTDP-4-dehydrorhamnose reductase